MTSSNVIGYVTEVLEDKILDDNGNVTGTSVKLKIRLKNTLGATKEVLVDGPSDLVDFFEVRHAW